MKQDLSVLRVGVPSELPPHPGVDPSVPHAPRRPVKLSHSERALALKNVLRYFPEAQHAALIPELTEELKAHGHIYCHRLRPTAYSMRAHPIDGYPARCRQAASAMLMIQNNLDPEVAQFPHELITYGGNGSCFNNWAQYALTMRYLSEMTEEQTLVLYSGHPLGLFPSSPEAPRLVITNGMVVPNYSSRDAYDRLYATCVSQYGQMTAGSFCYIGPQGIVHGTTITILAAARKYLAGGTSVIGFPYDEGCARNGGRRGAADGPRMFREMAAKVGVTPDPVSGVDIGAHVAIVDLGDVGGASLEGAHAALRARVAEALAAGHTPYVVGGGNDQSYPNARALLDVAVDYSVCAAGLPAVGAVNIDAHLDARPLRDGAVHSGCPFRQLLEDADFARANGAFVEFAAQPMQCATTHVEYVRRRGGSIVWHAADLDAPAAFQSALDGLGPCAFVSFDVDAIRAADNPAVSCPSPVGLSADDALAIASAAGAAPSVRLVDVSEFSPGAASPSEAYRSAKLLAFMFYQFALGRAKAHARGATFIYE